MCLPVFQGVQLLLDGVLDYLPNPLEVPNYALDIKKDEKRVIFCLIYRWQPLAEFHSFWIFPRPEFHGIFCATALASRCLSSVIPKRRLSPWRLSWKKENSASSRICDSTRCVWRRTHGAGTKCGEEILPDWCAGVRHFESHSSWSECAFALICETHNTNSWPRSYSRLDVSCRSLHQGTISKGDMLFNLNSGKKIKVPRLVRMHSAEMEVRCTLAFIAYKRSFRSGRQPFQVVSI